MDYAAEFQKLWDNTPDMGRMMLPAGYFDITRPLLFNNKTVRIDSWGTTCLLWNPEKPDPAAWCLTLGADDAAKRSQKGGALSNVWILGKNPHASGGCLRVRNAREWTFHDLLVGQAERGVLIDSSADSYCMNLVFHVKEVGGDKVALEVAGPHEGNNCHQFYGGHWAVEDGGTVVKLNSGGQGCLFVAPVMEGNVTNVCWFDVGKGGSRCVLFYPWLETAALESPGRIELREGTYWNRIYLNTSCGVQVNDRSTTPDSFRPFAAYPPTWQGG